MFCAKDNKIANIGALSLPELEERCGRCHTWEFIPSMSVQERLMGSRSELQHYLERKQAKEEQEMEDEAEARWQEQEQPDFFRKRL